VHHFLASVVVRLLCHFPRILLAVVEPQRFVDLDAQRWSTCPVHPSAGSSSETVSSPLRPHGRSRDVGYHSAAPSMGSLSPPSSWSPLSRSRSSSPIDGSSSAVSSRSQSASTRSNAGSGKGLCGRTT